MKSIEKAAAFFAKTNISSFIITNGVNNIFAWSGGDLFRKTEIFHLPVSKKVKDDLKSKPELKGDTT